MSSGCGCDKRRCGSGGRRCLRSRYKLLVGVGSLWAALTLMAFHLLDSCLIENGGPSAVAVLSRSADERRKGRGQGAPGKATAMAKDARDATGEEGPRGRRFYRYDAGGPRPLPGTARSHSLPNAVPPTRQIPRALAGNETYHISQRTNASSPSLVGQGKNQEYNEGHDYRTDFRTLYLYNPSILALHNTVPPTGGEEDPDLLSQEDLRALTGGDPRVRYVAAYRAYLGCNCFGTSKDDRRLMRGGEQLSYLAIALLDGALDVIADTDVLIDLNAGPARYKYFRQQIEDCRLFLLRGGIYLLCNEEMKRVRIERTASNATDPAGSSRGDGSEESIALPHRYPNIYGRGMTVTILDQVDRIGEGKNFNVFRTATDVHNTHPAKNGTSARAGHNYYIQLRPAPHEYRKIFTDKALPTSTTPLRRPPKTAPGGLPRATFDTPDTSHNVSWCPENPKAMNCSTPTEVPFFEMVPDHGTACCVRFILDGREVLVGIAHKKLSPATNFWLLDVHNRYRDLSIDQFVSRFVAYDARPPFRVVALSGWFCLGFAGEDESSEFQGERGSTLAGLNTHARLNLFQDTYNCPVIHFISGFSEAVGNTSRAVIGYGINDCHPRMFLVEKAEIARMLTMT